MGLRDFLNELVNPGPSAQEIQQYLDRKYYERQPESLSPEERRAEEEIKASYPHERKCGYCGYSITVTEAGIGTCPSCLEQF
jgi:hypothetical protein